MRNGGNAGARRRRACMGLAACAWLLAGTQVAFPQPDRTADIPYAAAPPGLPPERFTLDIYRDPEAGREPRPVVLYFHGGGFDSGGKEAVGAKPAAFVAAGYVFVAANRRYAVMPGPGDGNTDSADALAWILTHAAEFGGDPSALFLMGHSAGAVIAALLATDETYLADRGFALASIAGVACIDTAGYDKPTQVARAPNSTAVRMYRELGLSDAELVRQSPIAHVAPSKGIPPFLLYHRSDEPGGTSITEIFAGRLREAGVEVEIAVAADRTHGSINALIGQPGDPVTQTILSFFGRHAAKRRESQ